MYFEKGASSNGKRLCLCKGCHLAGRHKGSLLNGTGFRSIWGYLHRGHKIGKDGKKIFIMPGPLEQHLTLSQRGSSTQEFDQEKTATCCSIPGLGYHSKPHSWTSNELLHHRYVSATSWDTDTLFYTSRKSLSKLINASYVRRQEEIQLLFHGAMSGIHLSSDHRSRPTTCHCSWLWLTFLMPYIGIIHC